MENIYISVGPCASNAYIYILNDSIVNPNINGYDKIHNLTYDYTFNSIYITFDKEKANVINLNESIGDILESKNDKWFLSCLNSLDKKKYFKLLLSKTLNEIKFLTNENIQEEIKKLHQILNLIE